VQLASWGKGRPIQVNLGLQGKVLIIKNPFGIDLYHKDNLEPIGDIENAVSYRLSPDKSLLASADSQGLIQVWSLQKGEKLFQLEHASTPPKNPDENLAYKGFTDKGSYLQDFLGVTTMQFAPDGKSLATGYGDGKIELWNLQDGSSLGLLEHTVAPKPNQIAFSSDGSYLVSSGYGILGIWRMADHKLLNRIPNAGSISDAPFSPDNHLLITSDGGDILIWMISEGKLLYRYGSGLYWAEGEFSNDGKQILVNGGEQVRRLSDGHQILQPDITPTPSQDTLTIFSNKDLLDLGYWNDLKGAIFQGGKNIFAWGYKNTLYWMNVPAGLVETNADPLQEDIRVSVSPSGNLFAFCSAGQLKLFSIPKQEQLFESRCGKQSEIAISEKNARMAAGSLTQLNLLDLYNGNLANNLLGHRFRISSLVFSEDGKYLASGSENVKSRGFAEIYIWKMEPPSRILTMENVPYGVFFLTFSPDNRMLGSIEMDSKVRIWRISDGLMLRSIDANAVSLAFSPDSKLVAVGKDSGEITIWETTHWEKLATLQSHREAVNSLAFSTSGDNLLSASQDGTIRLWGIKNP
jgi:WD40 repeat protein